MYNILIYYLYIYLHKYIYIYIHIYIYMYISSFRYWELSFSERLPKESQIISLQIRFWKINIS